MEENYIKVADDLEAIELALRNGEVTSIFFTVNYGETSQNIIAGSLFDIAESLSHFSHSDDRMWKTLIGLTETLASVLE